CHPRADRDDTSLRYNAPLDTLQLNPTPFRRTAPVVRDRRHVNDVTDLVPERVQRAHGRFTARTGTLDAHFQAAHAVLLRGAPGFVGRNLRRERRALARTLEARAAAGRPGQHVALAVADRHDRVVEGRVDMHHAFRHALLNLLFGLGGGRCFRCICHNVSLGRRRCRFADHALARALASTGVGAGALTANRQPAPMAHAAIGAEVHQALDVHRHLAAQVAFDRDFRHLGAKLIHLRIRQIFDLRRSGDTRRRADAPRHRPADAIDRGQTDLDVLLIRYIDVGYTRHDCPLPFCPIAREGAQIYGFTSVKSTFYCFTGSPLSLLMSRIGANNPNDPFAPYNLAVAAHFLHRCSYFHCNLQSARETHAAAGQVRLAQQT